MSGRRLGWARWLVVAMLLGLARPSPADAQSAPPADDPARKKALTLLQAGNALIDNGDYVEALEKFQTAYALVKSPKLLLNIGTTLRFLGRNAQAAETYEQYLRDPEHDVQREAEIKGIVGELDAATGKIHVTVRAQGAVVRLDGAPIGTAPLDVTARIDPGDHAVVVEKAGMDAALVTLRVKAKDHFTISPEPTPPRLVTKTERVETGTGQRIAGFVIGGVGVAGVIVGGVFGGLAISANQSAKEQCAKAEPTICSARGVELGNTATTRATVSTASLVSGIGLATLGTILVVTAPSGKKAPRDTTSPRPAASGLRTIGVSVAPQAGGVSGAWLGVF